MLSVLNWLLNNWYTILVFLLLSMAVLGIIRNIIKSKKTKGSSCCGCKDCVFSEQCENKGDNENAD